MSGYKEIICESCWDQLYNSLGTMGLEQSTPEFLSINEEEEIECAFCNQYLDIDTLFINDFDEHTEHYAELIGSYLSERIDGCSYCEGNDIYSYERAINEGEPHPIFKSNIGQTVSEFMNDYEIPESFQPHVLQNLKCRCGYGGELSSHKNPDAGIFDYYDEIFTEAEIDNFWGYDYEPLKNLAERYDFTLTEDELEEFTEYIYSYPLLSVKHETGMKLYSILKKHSQSDNNSIIYKDTIVYRGRCEVVNNKNDMWEPPFGKSSHGRYNSVGRAVLYCAESKSPIPYEIGLEEGQFFTLAEIVVLNDLKCLDISEFDHLSKYFEIIVDKESSDIIQKSYLLPNFIAECCFELGYKGVKYFSASSDINPETNYALFNYRRHKDLEIKKIESIEYKKSEWSSYSFMKDFLIDF
ncbi:RES family NAD+ phosphorylase [Priestia megaterium]|uniref:RES family NAD+ phosphorylase n=1 Tax=Priestia megaterium TaxID=1404 RepID=UPI0035B63BC5